MTLDFLQTEQGDDPVVVEGHFAAPPAKVFQAWTDPDIVMKWFGPAPNSLHSAAIDLQLIDEHPNSAQANTLHW